MKLVFATNNKNKIKEVQALMPGHIELLSLQDIGCFEEVPETQLTIKGNAIQKAEYIKEHYGFDCFADDTGLEVEALNGEPGVLSARYAGDQRDANDNMNKLLSELRNKPDRNAQFKTVIALHINDELITFSGICKGEITKTKKGDSGFGYDPIFKPAGYEQTFAEMELSLKNKIGHRGKAVEKLVEFLSSLELKIESLLRDAWIKRGQGKYDEVRLLIEEAKELCKDNDYNALGRIFHIYMQIESDQNSIEEALTFSQKSYKYYTKANNSDKIAHSQRHIADLEFKLGNYSNSQDHYRTSIDIYKANSKTPKLDLANALRGFGSVLEKNGKIKEAISVWKETKSLYNDCKLQKGVDEANRKLDSLSNNI